MYTITITQVLSGLRRQPFSRSVAPRTKAILQWISVCQHRTSLRFSLLKGRPSCLVKSHPAVSPRQECPGQGVVGKPAAGAHLLLPRVQTGPRQVLLVVPSMSHRQSDRLGNCDLRGTWTRARACQRRAGLGQAVDRKQPL